MSDKFKGSEKSQGSPVGKVSRNKSPLSLDTLTKAKTEGEQKVEKESAQLKIGLNPGTLIGYGQRFIDNAISNQAN